VLPYACVPSLPLAAASHARWQAVALAGGTPHRVPDARMPWAWLRSQGGGGRAGDDFLARVARLAAAPSPDLALFESLGRIVVHTLLATGGGSHFLLGPVSGICVRYARRGAQAVVAVGWSQLALEALGVTTPLVSGWLLPWEQALGAALGWSLLSDAAGRPVSWVLDEAGSEALRHLLPHPDWDLLPVMA
jgi:hypothetical protein